MSNRTCEGGGGFSLKLYRRFASQASLTRCGLKLQATVYLTFLTSLATDIVFPYINPGQHAPGALRTYAKESNRKWASKPPIKVRPQFSSQFGCSC